MTRRTTSSSPRRFACVALLFLTAQVVMGEPTTAPATRPTSRPADDLGTLVAQLRDRDPLVRERARERLMSLTRDDLAALRDVADAQGPLSPTQRSLLRDVVMHVYLTGKHNFRPGGKPMLGIMSSLTDEGPPMIESRTIGYDGYRALHDGDVIVGLMIDRDGRAGGADAEPQTDFRPVASFADLQTTLARARAGDWANVRLLRNGQELETRVRLGPWRNNLSDRGVPDPSYAEAERYWQETFAERFKTRE